MSLDELQRDSLDDPADPVRTAIAIIGAGAGGLCMAARLREHGIDDLGPERIGTPSCSQSPVSQAVPAKHRRSHIWGGAYRRSPLVILEKSDGVGGTWRDNTYPDSACDVPSHLYSFSFASKPDWTRKWAKQPEILEYFESIADRHGLRAHLRFGEEVTACSWLDGEQCWDLRTTTGTTIRADVVVCALGQLNMPNIPDIPGIEDFRGTIFHSARWNHDHDLRGERVGVIGIGASAIQFVPPVADEAAALTLFQRSPNYVYPKRDRRFRSWERRMLTAVPGLQRLYRWSIYWRLEARQGLMRRHSLLGRLMQSTFRQSIRRSVGPRLPVEALVPDYPPGCKRVLIADRWYPTLAEDHVEVVTSPVRRLTPEGAECADGTRYDLDTLVFGTGFKTTDFLTPMTITGRGGADLNSVWSDGASAYLGLSMSGFPNLFLLYGPNTNLGHNSILFMIEQQVDYVISVLAEMQRRGATAAEVTTGAMFRWDREMRRRSARTVWAEGCQSWYKTPDGRITNNWVGRTTEYRRRLRRPRWTDWTFSGRS